eukprot:1974649-Alexandrium_andersonii.AAC.1
MSASLVGSEMCIRDSPGPPQKSISSASRRSFLGASEGAVAPSVSLGVLPAPLPAALQDSPRG